MQNSVTWAPDSSTCPTYTRPEVYCAYCGHDLSDANPIVYIDNQPVCAMCRAKMENQNEREMGGQDIYL